MRHKLVVVLLVAALSLTAFTATPASPAPTAPERPADYVSHQTAVNQCTWQRNAVGLQSYWIGVRFFHYGTAHITQCWMYSNNPYGWGAYSYCYQYVWGPGVARPYWNLYKQGWYPTVCW